MQRENLGITRAFQPGEEPLRSSESAPSSKSVQLRRIQGSSAPSAPCTSIHMELHLEACQILQGGVCQAVSTQVQGGEALQVEQRGIERSQLVAAQVDHRQVQSIEKIGRQVIQGISTQVQQLQGAQIPWAQAGAGIDAAWQSETASIYKCHGTVPHPGNAFTSPCKPLTFKWVQEY